GQERQRRVQRVEALAGGEVDGGRPRGCQADVRDVEGPVEARADRRGRSRGGARRQGGCGGENRHEGTEAGGHEAASVPARAAIVKQVHHWVGLRVSQDGPPGPYHSVRSGFDYESPVPRGEKTMRKIEELLCAPTNGADAPTLAHMEETLTDGYARALLLEAERTRLERPPGQAAHER